MSKITTTKEVEVGPLGCLFILGLIIAFLAAGPFVAMIAWNIFVPIVGGPQIDFIQAAAGYYLLSLAFGLLRR